MNFDAVANAVGALRELENIERMDRDVLARPYVRPQHAPFISTRFRVFDEYLSSHDPASFCAYTRLMPHEYEDLYELLAPELEHLPTHAAPIEGRKRLFIYLRYVGFGPTFVALSQEVCCGRKTVSDIVSEVTNAIIKVLSADAFPELTTRMFEECALKTQQRYGYPHAVGFLDGKHIRIKRPKNSGSMYWNYKQFYSIILLALCDADYRILAYDIGAPGRAGDAAVFRNSSIKRWVDENDGLFPPTRTLGGVGPVQYHILLDGGFGQAHRFIRPFTEVQADTGSRRRFNEKHSRARRMIESVFGILVRRFQVLQTPMQLEPEKAAMVVKSILTLHNLLDLRRIRNEQNQRYPLAVNGLAALHMVSESDGPDSANLARQRITAYYDSLYGPLM